MRYILYIILAITTYFLCNWLYLSIVNDQKLIYTLSILALLPPVLFSFRKVSQITHLKNKTVKDSYVSLFDKTNKQKRTRLNRCMKFYDILTTRLVIFFSTKILNNYDIKNSKIEPSLVYAKAYNCISVMNWVSSTLAILFLMFLNFKFEIVGSSDLANFWAQEKLEAFLGGLLGVMIYLFFLVAMLARYNPLADIRDSF